MKLRLALSGALAALLLLVLTVTIIAQQDVPSPYAGMKNPFAWDDASAQAAGSKLYPQCAGCHGLAGGNIAAADFSAPGFPQELEADADYYFWILSEGRLDRGMPPYKSSLTEEQRWQLLTYIHTLAKAVAEPTVPAGEVSGKLTLTAPQQGQVGQSLTLTATLKDNDDQPIAGVSVHFFTREDFFAKGLMEVGDAVTNQEGVAVFHYLPRQSGGAEVVARYTSTEAKSTFKIIKDSIPPYHAEAGIRLPSLGPEVFVGPESARSLGEMGEAPTSALRLPGGVLSWLLLVILAIMLVWFTYFRVIYQVFRIPSVPEYGETNTRVVPIIGMVIVIILGITLTLMVLTGPYTHFHLSP